MLPGNPAVSLVAVSCRGEVSPAVFVVAIPPPIPMRLEFFRILKRSIAFGLLDLADNNAVKILLNVVAKHRLQVWP
jgi:hypothetical protein